MGLIVLLVAANALTVSLPQALEILKSPEIRQSIHLTFFSCTATAVLSVFIATPIGYLMSRYRFPGRAIVDSLLDIPILLPPLVVGLSLLILFNRVTPSMCCLVLGGTLAAAALVGLFNRSKLAAVLGVISLLLLVTSWLTRGGSDSLESVFSHRVTFQPIAIILAQLPVAVAFSIRSLRNTFDQINPRFEAVALTLGCNRAQAFSRVVLPLAGRGILVAGTLAWARALGEFGPVLVFAGATRGRTEVLSTSVFLEINIGNLPGAAAISLLMILLPVVTLLLVRFFVDRVK